MTASTAPVSFSHVEDMTDRGMERTKLHLLVDMIVRALCTAIYGAEGWADVERFGKKKKDWFARFLELSKPKLLELLERTGAVVTPDAMHCQKETAQAICDKGADYVLTVKGNQPRLHEQIQKIFEEAGEQNYDVPGLPRLEKTERGHGRIERREYDVMPAPSGGWPSRRAAQRPS